MKILILGGAGMVGRKLAERLARDGTLGGREITSLALYDVVPAVKPAGAKFPVTITTGDLPADGETDKLVRDKPDVIFHLAAIVSGEAEQDFDKGYRINLAGHDEPFRFDPPRLGRRREEAAASSSPRRSRCSARRSPRRSPTSSSRRR